MGRNEGIIPRGSPVHLVGHSPGPTCRSAAGGIICYLHLSSRNPASSLRKQQLQSNLYKATQAWLH